MDKAKSGMGETADGSTREEPTVPRDKMKISEPKPKGKRDESQESR